MRVAVIAVLSTLVAGAVAPVAPSRIDDLERAARVAFARDDVAATVIAARALADEHRRVRALLDRGLTHADVVHADDVAERALRDLATALHRRAMERSAGDTRVREQRAADALYATYFTQFSSDDMRFFHAELLFWLERFPDAARAYALVRDGRWRRASAELAVRAWASQLHLAPAPRTAGTRAYTEAEREVLAACVRFLTDYPEKTDFADECAWREAKLRYDVGHFDEAVLRFERFIAERRESPRLEHAILLVMDTHAYREDYTALSAFIARMRADADLMRRPEARAALGGDD
jgi:hypothetical protein